MLSRIHFGVFGVSSEFAPDNQGPPNRSIQPEVLQ